jgi:hypothetical protein
LGERLDPGRSGPCKVAKAVQGMVGRAADPADVRRSGSVILSGRSGTITTTQGSFKMGFWTFDPGKKDRLAEIIETEQYSGCWADELAVNAARKIRSEFEVKEKPKAKTAGQLVAERVMPGNNLNFDGSGRCFIAVENAGCGITVVPEWPAGKLEGCLRVREGIARAVDGALKDQSAEHEKALKSKDDEIAKLKTQLSYAAREVRREAFREATRDVYNFVVGKCIDSDLTKEPYCYKSPVSDLMLELDRKANNA